MKERPILFSAPMVRALLAGTKTQTRRVVKPDHLIGAHDAYMTTPEGQAKQTKLCPYGQPGDRLWVRETHAPQADCWGAWERWLRGDGGPAPIIHYAADFKPFQDGQGFTIHKPFIEKWRPSIHMPRWASRITLEVTEVRVERLQDISEADALAEGVKVHPDHHGKPRTSIYSPVQAYADLWDQINGPESWAANPWVWAITFKRVQP